MATRNQSDKARDKAGDAVHDVAKEIRKKGIMEELREQHWTVDKRISLGHVYSFLGALVMSLMWVISLQYQITGNKETNLEKFAAIERQVEQLRTDYHRDIARLENIDSVQYTEIIRRLELLQAQMNEFSRNRD